MTADNELRTTPVSKAATPEEIGEFWDSHSLADHWHQTSEARFEIRATSRRRITLDPDVYEQVQVQARIRGISSETLVNLWLSERLHQT